MMLTLLSWRCGCLMSDDETMTPSKWMPACYYRMVPRKCWAKTADIDVDFVWAQQELA